VLVVGARTVVACDGHEPSFGREHQGEPAELTGFFLGPGGRAGSPTAGGASRARGEARAAVAACSALVVADLAGSPV